MEHLSVVHLVSVLQFRVQIFTSLVKLISRRFIPFCGQPMARGVPGSLTHCARPGIEPVSPWLLIRFISAEPRQELQNSLLLSASNTQKSSPSKILLYFQLKFLVCSTQLQHDAIYLTRLWKNESPRSNIYIFNI